jgi:NTP pyrophosphatase (non-canonical NTP hydrolase)
MTHLEEARLFRKVFEVPTPSPDSQVFQRHLIAEEYHEFIEATYGSDAVHTIKELADLVFVSFQYAAAMGWDLDEALTRVFKSNMSKLGRNGRAIRREDGKVLKGPLYRDPNLYDLVYPS